MSNSFLIFTNISWCSNFPNFLTDTLLAVDFPCQGPNKGSDVCLVAWSLNSGGIWYVSFPFLFFSFDIDFGDQWSSVLILLVNLWYEFSWNLNYVLNVA